jgi:hypothetical protein
MHSLAKSLVVASVVALSVAAHAQPTPITLDRLVSMERQKALGLDKLSPEQRAGVVRLLLEAYQQGLQEGQKPVATSPTRPPQVPPASSRTPSVIETQIDGDFEGWEGETIVKLMNGQIWQQTEYHYTYHYAFIPKVLIYRSGGGWKMKVDGVDKAVGVEQLK